MAENPSDLKYSKEHEWLKTERDVGIVGITDFAQHQLTDIVFVDLPEKGKKVEQGKPMAVIESVKSVSDVFSPVTGEVIEVNEKLRDNPEFINKDPYGAGWLVKIKVESSEDSLLSAGKFREDLFYRLNVIPIHVTPLEDRKEDIKLLVDHFIQKFNVENNRNVLGIDQSALNLLLSYHWPGNVRELENVIERAVVTGSSDTLTEDDFPIELALGRVGENVPNLKIPMRLEEGSKYLILKTLEKYNGNKTRAAEALGVSARTIRNKLMEYGLAEKT